MGYLAQHNIAYNASMQGRVAACVAEQVALGELDISDPDLWMFEHRREWAAAPGWDDAWEYAEATHPPDPEPKPPPAKIVEYDPGADEAVITDGMILSQIQPMLPPPP